MSKSFIWDFKKSRVAFASVVHDSCHYNKLNIHVSSFEALFFITKLWRFIVSKAFRILKFFCCAEIFKFFCDFAIVKTKPKNCSELKAELKYQKMIDIIGILSFLDVRAVPETPLHYNNQPHAQKRQ